MRMAVAAILLTFAIAGVNPADAASIDRAKLSIADKPYAYYLTTATARSPQEQERLAKSMAFIVASLSKQPNLAYLPQPVAPTVYRIDIRQLGWHKLPKVLFEHYPYRPDLKHKGQVPFWFRADWVVAELPDPIQTGSASHELTYGRTLKTGAEFRKEWGVSNTPTKTGDSFGFMEGKSKVQAKGAQRLMLNRDTAKRTRFFESFDSFRVAGKSSPSETLIPERLTYDGQELIAGMPKFLHGEFGALQAYFLNTGNSDKDKAKHDQHVKEAPTRLVWDEEGLRGPEIRDVFDCIGCHAVGMKQPSVNKYKEIILSGQRIYADKLTKEQIEQLYESGFMKELRDQDADFATAVRLCNGLTPEKNNAYFKAIVREYDADVDLEKAARELYVTADHLQKAIVNYSATLKLTEAVSGLAHNKPITRDEFVENIELLMYVLEAKR